MMTFSMDSVNGGEYFHNDSLLLRTFVYLHQFVYIYIPSSDGFIYDEIQRMKLIIDEVQKRNPAKNLSLNPNTDEDWSIFRNKQNLFIFPIWIEEDGSLVKTSEQYRGDFLHLLFYQGNDQRDSCLQQSNAISSELAA